MEEAPRDFIELFRSLNANRVEYLIVGGYAVAFYGCPRFNDDIDFFVNPEEENAARVLAALEDFGFEGIELSPEDFRSPDLLVSLGYPPERVDIVSSISGVAWPEAWAGRSEGSIGGEPVCFIGRAELVRNKRSTGKAQDAADADALERLPAASGAAPPSPA